MNGLICDNCGTVLPLDGRNNESSTGEEAAWIKVTAAQQSLDACSRSCATELLSDDGPLRPVIDDWLETISEITRTIREDHDDDED